MVDYLTKLFRGKELKILVKSFTIKTTSEKIFDFKL